MTAVDRRIERFQQLRWLTGRLVSDLHARAVDCGQKPSRLHLHLQAKFASHLHGIKTV
jgi:hypothetical protein